MSVSRILIVPFVVALVLLGAAPSASAAPGVTITHETVRDPVEWMLPADQCPDLPAGVPVFGTGQRHQVITTMTHADGSTTTIIGDLVEGTAVDTNARSYRFVYQNYAMETQPPSGRDRKST